MITCPSLLSYTVMNLSDSIEDGPNLMDSELTPTCVRFRNLLSTMEIAPLLARPDSPTAEI